jgi:Cu(I)/Ag(I) efflux system periplasmic protein CusF
MTTLSSVVFLSLQVVLAAGSLSVAISHDAGATNHTMGSNAQTMSETADGEVRKVNKDEKKITLRHGELKQQDMPPMTMVFHVKDPAMLDKVKAGDRVKFRAQNTGGALVITEIEVNK